MGTAWERHGMCESAFNGLKLSRQVPFLLGSLHSNAKATPYHIPNDALKMTQSLADTYEYHWLEETYDSA
jgi:hypothetical protein